MGFWICFNCGSHNVYEKMYIKLNRLACIIDDVEDLMVIEDNTLGYCGDCHKEVCIISLNKFPKMCANIIRKIALYKA